MKKEYAASGIKQLHLSSFVLLAVISGAILGANFLVHPDLCRESYLIYGWPAIAY